MDRVAANTVGVTSAAFGVATGHLVAALTVPEASPLVALGASIVDATPKPVREFAIRSLGGADKPLLLAGIIVVAGVLAALAGRLGARSRERGLAVIAALGLVLVGSALARPGAGPVWALPGLAATLAGAAALMLQLRWIQGGRRAPQVRVVPGPDAPSGAVDRRAFFASTAGVTAGAGLLGLLGEVLGSGGSPLGAGRRPVVLPPVASPPPPLPAGLESTVPGLTPLVTPVADFYRVDIALSLPRPDPDTWRLAVDGLVSGPYELSLADLLAMPLVERDITLTCVSNPIGGPYCGSTRWTGVLVADLLRRAGPDPAADMVLSRSVDGFTASTPLAVLLDGRDAMIALAMGGEPLTPTHGAPARLLTPGLYGYVGATKWLTRLTVTTFAADTAYWTARGWADRAPVKTATRIDTPSGTVPVGRVAIGGVAWATHRGIGGVEVRVDDGDWQQAILGPDVGLDYWRQWYLPWDATPGRHRLTARAYDAAGQLQTSEVADVRPDGASGYPVVTVSVRG